MKIKKRLLIPIIICAAMLFMNILARLCTPFADFYVLHIFHYISVPFTFLSGLFPFSVGEVMIIAAIVLVMIGLPLTAILLIFGRTFRKRTVSVAATVLAWALTFVFTTETMNCFVMYQCTPFSERYLSHSDHNNKELTTLYYALITEANKLAEEVSRDENGRFRLTCDYDTEAKNAMHKIAKDYPQLSGYYPDAKKIMNSYFMSQAELLGIYFPFSMESNYNPDMFEKNIPSTICHEYSHLKGVIQEDEANFIAYRACLESGNIEFRYSGVLDALEYVNNQMYDNDVPEAESLSAEISDKVRTDWYGFLPDDYWEENEDKEVISTEVVTKASETAIDTNIKMNGREDGIESYNGVVTLLLDYYFPASE